MREGASVDDQPGRIGPGLLDPCDQLALVVALPKLHRMPECLGLLSAPLVQIVQCLVTVDFRFTGPKQVEIRAVQDVDRFGHGRSGMPNLRPDRP